MLPLLLLRRSAAHRPGPAAARTAEPTAGPTAGPRRWRRVAGRVLTGAAAVLVLAALAAPNETAQVTPAGLLRVPVEALVGVVVLLLTPGRVRRFAAALAGALLGLVTVVNVVDLGFLEAFDRQFDPVVDWVLFDDAYGFVEGSAGPTWARAGAVAAAVLAVALPVALTLAVLRLTRLVVRHHTAALRGVAGLATVWVACAALGAQLVPGVPVASGSAATFLYDRAQQVPVSLADRSTFAAQLAADPFRDTPGDQLLTGLRGKDVVVSFVESYGRDAVENPQFAPHVGATLQDGTRRLAAKGFASRSAYLTSPTSGGGSWLAHATLLSGLWVNNEQRYTDLLGSDRLTLNGAFGRADWRTVGVMPGTTADWPEGQFYGYQQTYAAKDLGYQGPKFGWTTMPDQYTLSAFERLERGRADRPPLMAEIPLVSSHSPWAPLPRMVDWGTIGEGRGFESVVAGADTPEEVWRDTGRVRAAYTRACQYSLESLISYVETYGDDDLVLVFLGDHQPSPVIVGKRASRDVPITIVAKDPAVLDRISGWGWTDGLKPEPAAPVWRMDAFRDRFLTAFGPDGGAAR